MSERNIRNAYNVVSTLASGLLPEILVTLKVGEEGVQRDHRNSERQFAATLSMPYASEIRFCRAANKLKPEFLYGIMLHEWGHVFAHHLHDNEEESAADIVMADRFGIPINYGSRLDLQYVPLELVQTLGRLAKLGGTLDDLGDMTQVDKNYRRKMLTVNPYLTGR